jgi:phosphonate metabolism-associated iron-containing alcohol dehydrogenase
MKLNNIDIHRCAIEDILYDIIGTKSYLLVTSEGWIKRGVYKRLNDAKLHDTQCVGIIDNIHENPTISTILSSFDGSLSPDYILAIGGGSVLDAAKALSALYSVKGDADAFQDMLSSPDAFTFNTERLLPPIIAVPTTSGTGSEVTRWATIWTDEGQKYSLSHPQLHPKTSILDESFCISMPHNITLSSGLDALSHACEAVWNINHTDESDEYVQKALALIVSNLPQILENPNDTNLRKNMQLAAFYAGYTMSITRTALAHSISYPLTGLCGISHGIACSITLPEVMRFNSVGNEDRMTVIAEVVGVSVADLPEWCRDFLHSVGLQESFPSFSDGLKGVNLLSLKLIDPSRAGINIRKATQEDALNILQDTLTWLQAS